MILYGMYAIGGHECRYVGVSKNLQNRATAHAAEARCGGPKELHRWIRSVGFDFEIRPFRSYPGRRQSLYFESKKISEMILSGHRLFNEHHTRHPRRLLRQQRASAAAVVPA